MEWRFYGPVVMAVVLFLLVGTIFERRIEAAIRRIIEHQQLLLEASREEANLPVAEATDSSQASTSASQKTLESKKLNATKSLISSATFQSLPNSMSKPLECESSTFITGSSLERKSNAFIKPVPEITI
ncbi:uncharacterized protein LOC116773092 [Danaus plexippus]|uniref:Uncharacterized protein n=1 Tax=Danaus plexippus plexippus TaxID=278856 RepID=A0A212FPH4_DANPL|nr:uncharacterized protein LOC116773092 [Danaus plexippus]OWR55642.1 hypothetical protein KGM_214740 [Danaus plexippus plexippus]